MSTTEGKWEQGTPSTDMQIFVDAGWFTDVAGLATVASAGPGLFVKHVPATDASTFFANLGLLLRTGQYASADGQSQFGTAAGVAGPTTVANTSGPLALPPGIPPILAANLPTLGNIQRGPIPKGMQINSIDVIYTVAALAAAVATVGLTTTTFANATAPVVTNLIALAANGLPTAVQATPYVKNVAVATPAMLITADTEVIANVNFTGGATGTVDFYGIVVHCSFNFN
jgi:hypothetical protein